MASGPLAGSVAVEVVADLTRLDQGLRQGEAAARASAQVIANDLGRVERAAEGVAQAGTQAAEGLGRVRTASTVTTSLAVNMERATKAANDHARAVSLSANEWRNLSFQANDAITMLATGSSVFQVVASQGGQVLQVLQGAGGGIRGALGAIAQTASGAARGIGLVGGAFGTVAAVTATAVAAQQSYAASQRDLERSLSGVGRASGATAAQINAVARENAAAGGVSTRTAREMAGQFASTGRIGAEMYGGLIRSAKDYAATTGQDLADAQQQLARAFADPTKGADDLNERLGFLNDTTRETIQRLQAQGDRLGAQRVLFDAYAASLTKASELTSGWGRITASVGATIGSFWDSLGEKVDRAFVGGTVEDQLADAQSRLTAARSQSGTLTGRLFSGFNANEIADAEREVNRLQELIDKRTKQTEQAQAAQNSLRIGGIIRSTQPDREELNRLEDKIKDLRQAVAEPLKFGLDGTKLNEAVTAIDTLSRRFRSMADDIERFGSTSVAQMNRAADLANRTVGYAPAARSAAEINARFDETARTADSRELAGIERARRLELDTLRQSTILQRGQYRTSIADLPEQYRDRVYNAAIGRGIDPNLLATVFEQESRFRPDVISGQRLSPAGAIGPFQFMPGTAREYGIDPRNFEQSADAAALYLQRALSRRNGDVALALADYNAGPGRVNAAGGNIARLPQETRDYIARTLQRGPTTAEQVQDQEARTRALENERRQLQLATEASGRDAEGLRARTEASQSIASAQARGVEVSKELEAQYRREATERARIVTAGRVLQFNLDTAFDRDQLGRTAGEQAAYARARSVIGDTDSPAAQAAIQQQTLNDNLRQTKSLANEAFSGMLTDLRQGVSLSTSLGNMTGRLADRLLSLASDRVISSLFGGLLGGGTGTGGFMTGLASLFGGGSLPKFASGGITNGPSLAGEAGPEAVIPLSGGRAVPVEMRSPTNTGNPSAGSPLVVNINNAPSTPTVRENVDSRGQRRLDVTFDEAVAGAVGRPGSLTRAAMAQPAVVSR